MLSTPTPVLPHSNWSKDKVRADSRDKHLLQSVGKTTINIEDYNMITGNTQKKHPTQGLAIRGTPKTISHYKERSVKQRYMYDHTVC